MTEDLFNPRVYSAALRIVRYYVLENSGTNEDVEDVLQDGLMIYFEKCNDKNFALTCKPEHFIASICRNVWLKELRRKKVYVTVDSIEEESTMVDEQQPSLKERRESLIAIVEKNIKKLSNSYQKLLEYKHKGLSCDQIADKMNLKNRQSVKDKTYRCKERLLKLIMKDADYNRLMNDD